MGALLAFLPLSSHAQTDSNQRSAALTETSPWRVGMSPDRLAQIDTVMETAIAENRIPGAVVLVARNGRIVHHRAYGMADNTTGRALQRDDIFRIASQTKAITSTAVMMLWEQGLFQLDDPIARWIPEFKDVGVLKTFDESDGTWTVEPAKGPITIRHLLTHTSGIGTVSSTEMRVFARSTPRQV
jgi:CubicO group peptidase (beta-lactamase class C family)